MSRKTFCLNSTSAFLHAYNRGVDRGTIFFRERDYELFMALLAEYVPEADLDLLLYALLPNHFHLAIRQAKPYAVSTFMKRVCERFAKSINWTRSRSGHLFQDRFKVNIVEDPASLVRLSWYVHFNPVVAGLVPSIFDWKFSSIQSYQMDASHDLVAVEPILRLTGGCENYLRFLREYDPAKPDSVWDFLV